MCKEKEEEEAECSMSNVAIVYVNYIYSKIIFME